jgi:hypothetical protein
MAIQTATTGNLPNAQNIILAKARFTAENNAVAIQLFEQFTLPQGAKQVTVPKVGQATFSLLTDGVDMTDTQDIGMTTTDLTTAERGAKFILTDKLVRQGNDNTFMMVGKQLGDGLARIKDTDAIALYTNLNGGTKLGADNIDFEIINAAACIAFARANNFPSPVYIVHHPNAVYLLMASMAIVPETAGDPLPGGDAIRQELLKNFYKMRFDNVSVFQDANIAVESGVDSGIGVIASEQAMAHLQSVGFQRADERDESLRATEVVVIADYGVFELDDGYGAGIQYEIGAPSTSN